MDVIGLGPMVHLIYPSAKVLELLQGYATKGLLSGLWELLGQCNHFFPFSMDLDLVSRRLRSARVRE